ncbi:hypothetical protein DV711_08785 [Motiliproteus coralliicola]|uniref:Penicillin-binding protein activator n=1 Tax=Motiliproteus coralliicola TaxID=2283196 RepID=A0A369WLW9_9GAMM|nr:hypothetical protein DV711_08785 [Motiliproteus coralliicola]
MMNSPSGPQPRTDGSKTKVKLFRSVNAVLLLGLLVAGCTSQPPSTTPPSEPETPQGRELTEVEQLLLQAETAAPLARAEYTLAAAEKLLQQQEYASAAELLAQINPLLLPELQQLRLWLLQAEAANALQLAEQSQQWLARIENPRLLVAEDYRRYIALRSDNFRQLGDTQATLKALISESESAPLEQQSQLADEIWLLLERIDPAELVQMLQQENSYLEQGWYELAQLSQRPDQDVIQLTEALEGWYSLWGMHPAATNLPQSLQQLRQFSADRPTHIAVLLPQTGKLAKPGRAVIEGLMNAHYQQLQQGQSPARVSFFDSARIEDLQQFYLEAQQQQVDLVIGPLDKDRLRQLTERPGLPIPTLALNSVDSSTSTLNLFQFGLRTEDEAIQSADQAWADGHRVALTLTPATSWGDRIQQAFNQRWLTLGGVLAGGERFTGEKDFSDRISHLLATDASEARAKQLANLIRQPFEFEPRRRQDPDLLFMTALNKDARQIKPTLAFHYASDLPVYATSHLFDGQPDANRYQDLNGIRFNAMPWVIEPQNPARARLEPYRDNTRSRFGRLYALGIDSYRLIPYLKLLQELPGAHLQGQTGRLSIDLLGQVSRTQPWSLIKDGLILPQNAEQP